jgi:hypothetical protein
MAAAVSLAAAPNVREITPAGITINGSDGDWDEPTADFLAEMYEAGKPEKDVLSHLYGRYDCATQTFYVHVVTVAGWVILPSDNDNYVKLGQTDKLVDGSDGDDGVPPDFAYVGQKAWEASFHLAPGSYLGDNGLNVHAQVVPVTLSSTSAVADRRMDAIIDCSAPPPTPTPVVPTPTPVVPTPTPVVPTPTPVVPTPTPVVPTPTPVVPTPTPVVPTPTPVVPTPSPSGGVEPSSAPEPPIDPPIIVGKVNDQGTADPNDDRIVAGATFEFRRDDGDGTYEPVGDDAPVLAEIDATSGFAVFMPSEPGDYWVTESTAPPGLSVADPILVHYTGSPENCGLTRGVLECVPDDDQSGGFLVVAVTDSPTGGVGPDDVTPPPTDTVTGDAGRMVDVAPAAVLILLVAIIALVGTRYRQSR